MNRRAWEIPMSDLGLRDVPEPKPEQEQESPLFLNFNRLIGEGAIWEGPPPPEAFCRGRDFERGEYCLDCDRCGRELEIPGPGDVKRRRSYQANGELKGGKR